MKKNILVLLLFLTPLAAWRCGMDADYDVPMQDTTFRKFLTANNITYDAALAKEGLYKAVWPYGGSGASIEAHRGDTVDISYSGFLFAANTPAFGQGAIFTTNIADDAAAAEWTPGEMLPIEPVSFIVGNGQTLRGIDRGIEGCAKGDTVRLYLTSDWAYGNQAVGYLKPGTPVVFKVYVENVRKR